MSNKKSTRGFNPIRFLQKFTVSAFVVLSFGAYALHEHFSNVDADPSAQGPAGQVAAQQAPDASAVSPTTPPLAQGSVPANPTVPQTNRQGRTSPQAAPTRAPAPRAVPTTPPTAAPQTSGAFRDGTYTGPRVNAFWGMVQVQVSVRNGQIADVQFLQFPSDRRTSVRINNFAVPTLQSEAIQAQSANVDVISGATLTSEAFMQSLQSALSKATTGS